MEYRTHSDIARAGANAANKKRTVEESTKIGKKGARAAWKGHKKKDPDCPCVMCTKRRLKKANK